MSKFRVQTLATINSDKAEEISNQNFRKANSAFRSQIAGLEAQLVDAENAVESATSAFAASITPKSVITDNASYMENILRSRNNLFNANERLTKLQEDIAFFTDLSNEYFAEAVQG